MTQVLASPFRFELGLRLTLVVSVQLIFANNTFGTRVKFSTHVAVVQMPNPEDGGSC